MAIAAAVAFVNASELLPSWVRLLVGAVNAALVVLVAGSQPDASKGNGSKPPPAATTTTTSILPPIFLVVVLLGSGCLSLLRDTDVPSDVEPWGGGAELPPAECVEIDRSFVGWTTAGFVADGLAAAAAAVVPLVGDDEGAVLGLSVTAAGLALFGGAAALVANHEARRFAEWCSDWGPLPVALDSGSSSAPQPLKYAGHLFFERGYHESHQSVSG